MPSHRRKAEPNATGPLDTYAEQRLVSVTKPVSGFSPDTVRALVPDGWHIQWFDPVARHAWRGWGAAAVLRGDPADRFADIQRQAQSLFGDAVCRGPGPGPRLAGGFSFSSGYLSDKVWQSFAPGCFVLPHFQHELAEDQEWLTINVLVDSGVNPQDAVTHCCEILSDLDRNGASLQPVVPARGTGVSTSTSHTIENPVTKAEWHCMIGEALDRIRASQINKVALARMRELNFTQPPDTNRALARLATRYSACYRFLFQQEDGSVFLGASPELLCALDGSRLHTMALAGTAPCHRSAEADRNVRRELLSSAKNWHEHRIVVDNLLARLHEFKAIPDQDLHTGILSLHNVHHLHTPISATPQAARHVLEWLEHLHPTAALGGDPANQAMSLIDALERQPRGWYAAPFGLFDRFGHGTFCVGIRSAVIHKARAWLFAGAGIVSGSRPDPEWDETEWKFQPMYQALTAQS